MTQYQPKYNWRRTQIDERDEPTDTDWSGYDGVVVVGRIQQQLHGPMKAKWLWSGHGPRVKQRPLPHRGYEVEGRKRCGKSRTTMIDCSPITGEEAENEPFQETQHEGCRATIWPVDTLLGSDRPSSSPAEESVNETTFWQSFTP